MLAALKVTEQHDRRLINQGSVAIGSITRAGVAPTLYHVNLANNFMPERRAESARRCFAWTPVGALRCHEFIDPGLVGICATTALGNPRLPNGRIHSLPLLL